MSSNNKVKISFIQFNPVIADKQCNFSKIEELCNKIPKNTEVIVLPELAFTGYNFAGTTAIMPFAEVANEGETSKFLAKIAKSLHCYIVAGFAEIQDSLYEKNLFNSSMLVGPDGFLDVYRKIHLFRSEKKIFKPGRQFKVCKLKRLHGSGTFNLGLLICFDWIFTESWLAMFKNNAEIIAHCANLVLPGKAQKAVPVMAMMHKYAVVSANRWGSENIFSASGISNKSSDALKFTGESLIADSDGSVLVKADAENDFVGSCEVDLSRIRDKQVTSGNNMITDRFPELYTQIFQ